MTSRARALWLTARPKTLSAAFVPIVVATALVFGDAREVAWRLSVLALLSATFIQIGTNFVNDALDFVKGADGATRLGDARASQSGWFSHRRVMAAGLLCFGLATVFGLPLVIAGGWPILVVGLASLALGYLYTGGPFPLAYLGLGDLFVILFFGLVAVAGVYFLHAREVPTPALVAGLQVGLLATVLIAINNLRDLEQDRLVGKRTLAVRLGPKLGRLEVPMLYALAFGLNVFWFARGDRLTPWLPLVALPLAIQVARAVCTTSPGRAYNGLLARASAVHVLFGALLSVGLVAR